MTTLTGKICMLCDKDFALCKCYAAGEKKTRDAAAAARRGDPSTSKEAAASLEVAPIEQKILEALKKHGPMTTTEITEKSGIAFKTVTPRLRPMERQGLVRPTGESRFHGERRSMVWAAL
jgi:DNA-binding MarR family transcriptional regulator